MCLLSLIPHLIRQLVTVWWWAVGVAGWNTILLLVKDKARTLLGPEKTSAVQGVLWSASGWVV